MDENDKRSDIRQDTTIEDKIKDTAKNIHSKFNDFTGLEKLEGFSIGELFSEVFRKHDQQEVEEYFTTGTRFSTPALTDVDTRWPRPWVFFRVLTASLILYLLLHFSWACFKNTNFIPGLMTVGTVAIPLSTLVLFYELNVRRNVTLYQVVKLVLLGGITSLIFSSILFAISLDSLGWMGPSIAALIEEPGKLLALVVVARHNRRHYKLNGLLFGAAVGTGFAVFESLGYAFNVVLHSSLKTVVANAFGVAGGTAPVDAMVSIVVMRGVLSPFAHIIWTAIAGVAVWRVMGKDDFSVGMLAKPSFWHLFLVPVVLHAVWNAQFEIPMYGKYVVLGGVGWTVVLALVQEGLKQLRAEKIAAVENGEEGVLT